MKLKECKGMSLIAFTIVLAVLVVLAGGVIVYLLNNPVKENVAIQNPTGVQSNLGSIETNIEHTKEPITNEIVKEKMTADEKFSVYVNGVKKIFQNLENGGIKYVEGFDTEVDTSEYVGSYILSSEYVIKIDNKQNLYINDKKVTSDVLNISKTLHAQDGAYTFVMKSDGSLEYISGNDYINSKFVSHKLEGFKNIVDVIEIESVENTKFLAVDIEGKSYEVDLWK